jgi:2-polyprenyl-6-methoxyphenol hydroxylase-like FAD-dependent oxidoreductase
MWMSVAADSCDVLVAGAGPAGLTLANELARRHVRTRLVDPATHHTEETRALGVQARTVELLDRMGLADQAVAQGLQVTRFNVFSERQLIAHFDLGHLETPFPYTLMLPQNQMEELLENHLCQLGGTVERGTELVDFLQQDDGVEVHLRDREGRSLEVFARWLVGCDGAHSRIRNELGVQFVGDALEESFAVADVRVDWRLPYDELFAFLDRGNFTTFFPMRGGLHRLAIAYTGRETPAGDVTLSEVQRAVAECGPPGVRVLEMREGGRFRINQRAVERQSKGRVFLAGDAAHVNSVVGAQGMNIGMQDAFNLGWKLALVASGRAADEILTTYSAERQPAVRRTVSGTRRFTQMTLLHDPFSVFARRHLAPLALARRPARERIEAALSQLDISYAGSDHRRSRPAAGDRAPDVALPSGRDDGAGHLVRQLRADEYSLLVFAGRAAGPPTDVARRILASYPGLVRVHYVLPDGLDLVPGAGETVVRDQGGQIGRRFGVEGEGAVLIRPDGYLAARSDSAEQSEVTAYLRHWLREVDQHHSPSPIAALDGHDGHWPA